VVIFQYLSFITAVMGVAVIVWGVVVTFFELLYVESKRIRGQHIAQKWEFVRHHLGFYILMGLEFMIAADIIMTLIRPSLQEIAILGSMVMIRTVISYFLDKEMAQGHVYGGD